MAFTELEIIFNEALGIAGEYQVEEGDTTSKQYVMCNTYYEQARDEVLAAHTWSEAMVQVIIPVDTTAPLFKFTYRYAIPSSSLRVTSIDPWYPEIDWDTKGTFIETDWINTPNQWETAKAYIVGEFVTDSSVTYEVLVAYTSDTVTNDVAAGNLESKGGDLGIIYATYITQLTDITKYSPRLKDAIAMKLAIKVTPALHNDPAAKRALIEEFENVNLRQARSVDSQQRKPKITSTSSWIRSRTSGTYYG
jgi:hypothetical protein